MTRVPTLIISCSILGVLACGGPPPGQGAKAADKKAADNKAPDKQVAAKPETPPAPPPEQAKTPDPVEPPPVEEPPAEEPPTEDAPPAEANAGTNVVWKAPDGVDIRSDAAMPPGTPAANAAAFKKLPVAKADGPPVSHIGPSGIHFDSLVVGRGWEKSRCVEETSSFDPNADDRVNICLRVVHPADLEEVLTVEWGKKGSKATRRSTVTVKPMHAYLTRSYLPIKPSGYTGEWTATIKTEDGTVLAEVSFTVE